MTPEQKKIIDYLTKEIENLESLEEECGYSDYCAGEITAFRKVRWQVKHHFKIGE